MDYGDVDYFGVGPDTLETSLTQFGIEATHVAAHATLRPTRWFDIDAQVGLLSPSLKDGALGRVGPALINRRSFPPSCR